MKSLLIIVPGSKTKTPPLIKSVFKSFYDYFGVDNKSGDWAYQLSDYVSKKSNFDVEVFEWSGGITKTFSLKPATKELSDLIENRREYDRIVLFCKSLGGVIGESATNLVGESVDKLIYVSTPHKRRKPKLPRKTEIVNLYSNEDDFVGLANLVLNFGGTKVIEWGKNVELKGLKHSEFNYNKIISYDGRREKLFDLYLRLITSYRRQE